MHPRILAQRTGIASEKLVANARRLAQALDLPEDLVNALIPSTNNSQIRPMLTLEACANLVEAAANQLETYPLMEVGPVAPLVIETVEGGNITISAALETGELATVDDPGLNADEVAKVVALEPKVKRGRTK